MPVSNEEQARTESIYGVGEAQVCFHAESGERDVEAINHADEVKQKNERQQPPGNTSPGSVSYLCSGSLHHARRAEKDAIIC